MKSRVQGKGNLAILRDRIPRQKDILLVFSGVVFIIYSWSIRGFLYQLSSLLLYHSFGEILAVFAYLMAFALFESLVISSSLIMLGFLLPPSWFRQGFAYKGFIATLVTGIAMIVLQYYLFSLNSMLPPMPVIYLGFGCMLILLILLIWFFQRRPSLQNFLLAVQERLQIFLYFYIPLGIMGLTVVLLRSLGG